LIEIFAVARTFPAEYAKMSSALRTRPSSKPRFSAVTVRLTFTTEASPCVTPEVGGINSQLGSTPMPERLDRFHEKGNGEAGLSIVVSMSQKD
jgi:hypothetical protein